MTRGVGFGRTATFTELMSQFDKVTGDGKESRHLRLKETEGGAVLYTHDKNRWHGLNFLARREKHRQASEFVKNALINQFGEERATSVLLAAGLTDSKKSITVGEFHKVAMELDRELDALQALLPDLPPAFIFTDEENEEIGRVYSDDLKIGSVKDAGTPVFDPQFAIDVDRQGTYLVTENETTHLSELLLGCNKDERVEFARRSMHAHLSRGGDSQITIARKTAQLSKLMNQKALAPTFLKLCEKLNGLPMGVDDYKYVLHRENIDGQLYQVVHLTFVKYVSHVCIKGEMIPMRQGSFVAFNQKMRVKDEDLAKLDEPPVTVVSTKFFHQLEHDRHPIPLSNPG